MFRSLLVPLDQSSPSEQALPLAVAIARRSEAVVELVKVHTLYALEDYASAWVPYEPAKDAEFRKQEQTYLDATAKLLGSIAPVKAATKVLTGLVGEAILGHAKATNADLIVMTTHGRGPTSRFFLGSVADELVRSATVPVLLVRPSDPAPQFVPEPRIESILVPLDGSKLAEQALAPAVELARLFDAKCTLFRVVDSRANGRGKTEANAYLHQIANKLRDSDISIQTANVFGQRPADVICEQARALPNGLVVLATHGWGGVRRMLLGSTADKVIRAIEVPLLVCGPIEQQTRQDESEVRAEHPAALATPAVSKP
jgi:nucleotide-binding universal stress UspA family protein